MYEIVFVVKLISFLFVFVDLNAVHGTHLSSNFSGNNVEIPTIGHNNESRLPVLNITSNKLSTRTNSTSTTVTLTKALTIKLFKTHTPVDMSGESKGGEVNASTNSTTVSVKSTTQLFTTLSSHVRNYTLSTRVGNYTTAPPPHGDVKHHFNMKILDYILIPVGCLLAIVISYCLARHVQKVRRKRRLERELFHQYSYPNSEADDMEEQNIGDIESVINAQFVSFSSDRSDKNLYEDSSEVNLAFDETSKLVVQEPALPVSSELEASTSFNS